MKVIDFNTISKLGVNPLQCVKWVEYILKNKYSCELPPKISLHMGNNIFMNTMPSYIPMVQRHGVKIVSRYPERVPSLISEIMLYDTNNGLPVNVPRTLVSASLPIAMDIRVEWRNHAFPSKVFIPSLKSSVGPPSLRRITTGAYEPEADFRKPVLCES